MTEAREGAEVAAWRAWARSNRPGIEGILAEKIFRAGFFAGLAHATTPAEPSATAAETERVTVMWTLLREIGEYPNLKTIPYPDWERWQAVIATLLGHAATEGDR